MGTTYYFTVCAYVTNVGNGTSYNVNAKTKGLMLYKNGTFYNGAGIITGGYSGLIWSNNGSYLYNTINTKTAKGIYYIGSTSTAINFASYSKIGIKFKLIAWPVDTGYTGSKFNKFNPGAYVMQSSGYYSYTVSVANSDRISVALNGTYTATFPYTIVSGNTGNGIWKYDHSFVYETN
ncbi:MAG: hypothetical protein IKA36_05565, partial [Clostridia bacterium]|nr:hypothetical protein [Clostridia bacterium]